VKDSVGIVETQYLEIKKPFKLESGKSLDELTIAYETYGQLNQDKTNAVLILHALSGDAHAAGKYHPSDKKTGWWDNMIGPGKAFDTSKHFVICSNVLGGCKGTTGPSSINPKTSKPYGFSFPVITIKDMVRAQNKLVEHLKIKKLLSVAGGSMGGMEAIQWIVTYPKKVKSAVIVGASLSQSAQNIAFHEVGRQAILSDPNWQNGDYYDSGRRPFWGLSAARMIGHITYLSEQSMQQKFGRLLRNGAGYTYDFSTEFEVQNYLKYQGKSFVERFDANSYLYITKAIDYFNLDYDKAAEAFSKSEADILTIAFSSDWLYPPKQVKEVVKAARQGLKKASYYEVKSDFGHDAFLIEAKKQKPVISGFLNNQLKK